MEKRWWSVIGVDKLILYNKHIYRNHNMDKSFFGMLFRYLQVWMKYPVPQFATIFLLQFLPFHSFFYSHIYSWIGVQKILLILDVTILLFRKNLGILAEYQRHVHVHIYISDCWPQINLPIPITGNDAIIYCIHLLLHLGSFELQ